MKTNPYARGIKKIQVIARCLAVVGLAVAEIGLGVSLAARYGQYGATPGQTQQAPSLTIGDMMAASVVVR
jgi:hypothetical protein